MVETQQKNDVFYTGMRMIRQSKKSETIMLWREYMEERISGTIILWRLKRKKTYQDLQKQLRAGEAKQLASTHTLDFLDHIMEEHVRYNSFHSG